MNGRHTAESLPLEFLIGYSLEEAEEVLQEEQLEYEVLLTAPPKKQPSYEDVRVIAVRVEEHVVLICADMDWSVS